MQYNLKNRPRRVKGQVSPKLYWINDIGLVMDDSKIEEWFEGFEKELRVIKKDYQQLGSPERWKRAIYIIDKILGEDSS